MSLSCCVLLFVVAGLCVRCPTSAEKAPDINRSVSDLNEHNEGSSSDQLAAILDRLESLETLQQRNNRLLAQLLHLSSAGGMNKVLQDLEGVCEELNAVRSGQPTQHVPDHTTTAAPTTATTDVPQMGRCPPLQIASQLQITSVVKEETDTVYKVTVCYASPEKPEVSRSDSDFVKPEPIEHHRFGEVILVRNKSENNESAYLGISFELHSEYYVHLSLRLDENSPDEVHLPNIQMKVQPGNKIIYDPGSDVDIEFNIINEANAERKEAILNMTSLYLKSNTEKNTVEEFRFIPNFEMPEEISDIQFTETRYSEENATQLLHMPYSPRRTGGYIAFQMASFFNCIDGCLVKMQTILQRVVFYPVDRSGPFPKGFIGIIQEANPRPNRGEVRKCYEDNKVRNCVLHCRAAGDDPTVDLIRADHSPVSPHSNIIYNELDYYASWFWEFENPTLEDSGDYLCQAWSPDGRLVVTRTMTVSVGREAEIVRDLSGAKTFPNGSLSAVCVAEGIPAPTLRFGPQFNNEPTTLFDEADVTVTQLNRTTSQATLLLPNWRKFNRNEIDDINCFAEEDGRIRYLHRLIVDEYK